MLSILVAIVDDDTESILILRDFLESKSLAVECFANAEALLEAFPCRFGAILLDINLPGIWGSECSYRLRSIGYKGPIIAISGNIELWDADDLKELGFNCALGKPLNPPQLIALLKKHIKGWTTQPSAAGETEGANSKQQDYECKNDGCKCKTKSNNNTPSRGETDSDRLRGLLAPNALSVGLVSALAGDREMTPDEGDAFRDLSTRRGEKVFSDLLYAITHQFFPLEIAETLWRSILRHKIEMSKTLNRNIIITVATLDYLSSLKGGMDLPTLISEARIAEIADLSMRDGLTGLFNHTSCIEILDLELRSNQRYGTDVSLIMLDIDNFKQVNDRYGHQEGDRILLELSRMIGSATRDSDICCRYGGEEFVVILPFTDMKKACAIAHRICLEAQYIYAGEAPVTVSCGVAVCGEKTTTSHTLIAKADRGLYQAKHLGKNRFEVAT